MALIYPSFCIRLVLNCDVCPVPCLRARLRCSHVEIKKKQSSKIVRMYYLGYH